MTIQKKKIILVVVILVVLIIAWALLGRSSQQNKEDVFADYDFKSWVGTKQQWLENMDAQHFVEITATKKLKAVEKKHDDLQEDFAPRQEIKTQKFHIISGGDTLQGISQKYYDTSRNWRDIYEVNRDVIDDPDFLEKGVKIIIPDLELKNKN